MANTNVLDKQAASEEIARLLADDWQLLTAYIYSAEERNPVNRETLILNFRTPDGEEERRIPNMNFGYDGGGPIDAARLIYEATGQADEALRDDIRRQVFAHRTGPTWRQIDIQQ